LVASTLLIVIKPSSFKGVGNGMASTTMALGYSISSVIQTERTKQGLDQDMNSQNLAYATCMTSITLAFASVSIHQEIHKILPNFPRFSGLLSLLARHAYVWHGPPHCSHDHKSEAVFDVIKHLICGTVYYINIFTNLYLLSIEMYLLSKLSC